ncbi:hypothetical protein QBC41DRAFT_332182 [Cercophora samala]|uniref:Nucleoporin NUP82 n=1 Tax=Cercophora samala TaxID=330535 RepID=A0AA40CZ09_9PEZI|nr:hypothetical protein QBC41DRAFT_332182 [Cercophora samala]
MPRIKTFAPSWLIEPSPGHKLFEPSNDEIKSSSLAYNKKPKPGPRRTIAHRGTEVFVAVGKQIRWGDLVDLKESWETKQARTGGVRYKKEPNDFEVYDEEAANGNSGPEGYRIIKTPVAEDIRQLVMSPNNDFLAVLTSHTVHICILPDSTHLNTHDSAPFKPKFYTLGPTTHVTSRAAIVSAIWHPLGVNGTALVTVTEDAVVRVWELSATDRWSFDAATLAIDLKRLADGTCVDQDFSASVSATNKAFSPDSFDMEVAAACFPARTSGGWSPMTLWIAMTGGDVYALCPLLPKRWAPPPTLIPSLSVSIVSRVAATEDSPDVSYEDRLLAQQQLQWMSDLDNQEPKMVEAPGGDGEVEVYNRPARPGIVPKLQGPFDFDLNPEDEQDDEIELKDIYVIGEKPNMSDLMMGEDEELAMDEEEENGLSISIVCLLSTSGQVKICLATEGVEAEWLPSKIKSKLRPSSATSRTQSLLTFQTFDTVKPAELTPDSWPMFSEDATSKYSFYVTNPAGITLVNLESWVSRLESELSGESEAGADFRIDVLVQGHGSERERVYTQPRGSNVLSAPVVIRDQDIGHLLLSSTHNQPIAIFFDTPELELVPIARESPIVHEQVEIPEPEVVWHPRPVFHPSDVLVSNKNAVPAWVDLLKTGRKRPLLQQEIRLSMATLEVFTEGHKVASNEVFEIQNAVAELFRKCEALQFELRDQLIKAGEVKKRIDTITGDDLGEDDDDPISINELTRSRIDQAQRRQEELASRMERIKKKLGRATTRDLSDKEKAWVEEVKGFETSILGSEVDTSPIDSKTRQPWRRFEEIKELSDSLLAQAERLHKKQGEAAEDGPASPAPGVRIPADIRKAKMAQVMSLLDRESMMVDAVKDRLERLTVG